jgi:hypothetical protein
MLVPQNFYDGFSSYFLARPSEALLSGLGLKGGIFLLIL